jgi:hypothetical protein
MNKENKDRSLSGWFDVIMNSKIKHVHYINNYQCVKCDAVELIMVKIGSVPFCEKCAREEFTSKEPLTDEREKYQEWLKKYNKKLYQTEG